MEAARSILGIIPQGMGMLPAEKDGTNRVKTGS